jgi:hypothetical protein
MSTPAEPQNGPQQAAGAAGQAPETQAATGDQNAPQTGAEGTGKAPKFEGEYDPAKAARLVENLRTEVQTERDKRTALETQFSDFMIKFSGLFGATGEQQQLTPEQLAANAEQSQASAREAQVHLAVFKAAAKHGGDPDALLDSAAFTKAIGNLDPTADTFAANVEKAIKTAVEGNPRLKAEVATAVAPAGGFDMNNGTSGKRQLTKADVDHLAATNPAALVKARADGLLRDYLAS